MCFGVILYEIFSMPSLYHQGCQGYERLSSHSLDVYDSHGAKVLRICDGLTHEHKTITREMLVSV